MRIRMVQQLSGTRADGRPWPPAGATLEVSDEEGMELCRKHSSHSHPIAVPVVEERKLETGDAPPDPRTETRAVPHDTPPWDEPKPETETPKRGPGRPRKDA